MDPVKFIYTLSQAEWPNNGLPQWTKDVLSLPLIKHDGKQTKQEIKVIQQLILNHLSAFDGYLKDVQTLNERLEKLKSSLTKEISHEQVNQKIAKIKLNADFSVETVLDLLNLAIEKKQNAKILRCYHFIFDDNQLPTILSHQGTKYPTLVIEILKRALDHTNYDEVKCCLAFIQQNQLHASLKEMPGLIKLFNIEEVADFALMLCDENTQETIYVNAAILALRSPYFLNFFGGYWLSKSSEGEKKEMKISCHHVDAVRDLIQYFYTGELTITHENIEEILKQAHAWNLKEFVELCEKWFLTKLEPEDILKFYLSGDSIYCDTGILNDAMRPILLKDLSLINYKEYFKCAEMKNDDIIKEKILNYLTKCFLQKISSDPKAKNPQLNIEKEGEILHFLTLKGAELKKLDLKDCVYTKSLAVLQTLVQLFPHLSGLDLGESSSSLTLAEMQELVKLKELKELHFYGSNFEGLMHLTLFKKMEELSLCKQSIHLEMTGIKELHQSLVNEEKINRDLSCSEFAKASLARLFSEMPKLRKLDLYTCQGIQYLLPGLKNNLFLTDLTLNHTTAVVSFFRDIASLSHLERLSIINCDAIIGEHFTIEFFKELTNLKDLTSLTLISNDKKASLVTNNWGIFIAELKKLQELCINNFDNLDYEFVNFISDLPLKKLNVKGTFIDARAIDDFKKLTQLTTLELPDL